MAEQQRETRSVGRRAREKRGAQDMLQEEPHAEGEQHCGNNTAKKLASSSQQVVVGCPREETSAVCHSSGGVETVVHEPITDGQESGEVGVVPVGDVGMVPETAADMPHAEDVQMVLKQMVNGTKEFYAKWIDPFSESDEFELFFPTRLDELLKEAYALEEGLKQQKERMKEMLTHLSQTLDRLSHTT